MTASPENRPPRTPPESERPRTGARRIADRHYMAVVAAEARRLARQLRPAVPPRPPVLRLPAEGVR